MAASYVILGASPTVLAAAPAYIVFYACLGGAGPLLDDLLHQRTRSEERATMLSTVSLAVQGVGTLGALGLPALASGLGFSTGWFTSAVIIAAAAFAILSARPGKSSIQGAPLGK